LRAAGLFSSGIEEALMAIGIDFGRGEPLRSGVSWPSRFTAPPAFHALALWLAAAVPAAATLLLIARLAA
jgi:hypothetical protein